MAKERMVTRTVDLTVSEVMCVDVTTAEVSIENLEVSGLYPDNDKLMKQLKKVYEDETHKVVSIQKTEIKEILYGMSEIDFIKNAVILPPRGTTAE